MLRKRIDDFKTGSLELTYDLISDVNKLDNCFIDFDFLVSKEVHSRLNNWLSFFNNDFIKYLDIYSDTIYALCYSAKNNPLFRTQTRYEFEISLTFYERAIDSGHLIQFADSDGALFFLNTSLLYGCFPGMVISSMSQAFSVLESGSSIYDLRNLFKRLFVKYETPNILLNNLNHLNKMEMDVLMYVLQGNNIRKFDKLPIPLSKKEAFIFINKLPQQLKFKDYILERAIVCSKLLLTNPTDHNLLYSFVKFSKIFQYKLFVFYEDLNFWKSIFNLLSKINWSAETIYSAQEYIDFFEFKRYSNVENYTIKNRTIESINQAIYELHYTSDYGDLLDKINLKWKGSESSPMKITRDNEEFLIKEITNGKELFKETSTLKHCVYSYIEECANDYISIWSLRKKINSIFKSIITIEVKNNTITQIAGKRNREVDNTEKQIIKEWAIKMKYSFL